MKRAMTVKKEAKTSAYEIFSSSNIHEYEFLWRNWNERQKKERTKRIVVGFDWSHLFHQHKECKVIFPTNVYAWLCSGHESSANSDESRVVNILQY